MLGQGRLGDKSQVQLDAHGCPACPHPGAGPAIAGSPDVNVNGRPTLRVGDPGIHAACCGTNTWTATAGSSSVFINGKAAHRMGDQSHHCGGMGQLIEGSPNVIVGEASSGGAGSGLMRGGGNASAMVGGATSTGGGGGIDRGPPAGGSTDGILSGRRLEDPRSTHRSAIFTSGAALPLTSFLELALVDQDDEPLAGARYRVKTADGRTRSGTLDERGKVRLDSLQAGPCEVTFPDLADDEWGPA